MAANRVESRLAYHLASPFMLPGQTSKPLSFRLLPEGGMVVISADGRKLWFTVEEVDGARRELGMPISAPSPERVKSRVKAAAAITATPCGGSRDGRSEMIVLPPDLQHLEKLVNDKTRRH